MRRIHIGLLCALSCSAFIIQSRAATGETGKAANQTFEERLPVYGVVKPSSITTLLAINHGVVVGMHRGIGDSVSAQGVVLEVMEREALRSYRTAVPGKVAKLHVTKGAAVTPGMPLVTVLDPSAKIIEVSLSAKEAHSVAIGTPVVDRATGKRFGTISKVSPLVDPDSGAVISYVKPDAIVSHLIGDIISLSLVVRTINDCDVVGVAQIDSRDADQEVEAISGSKACLKRRPASLKQKPDVGAAAHQDRKH